MKPARIVLLLIVSLIGSMLVLSAGPASSQGAGRDAANVRTFTQKHRSDAYWRRAMKTAKPMDLRQGTRSGRTSQRPASDEVGAPVVIPPTGPEGGEDAGLPERASAPAPRTQGSFPAIPFSETEITDPSQPPYPRHGKIFFTQSGGSYVCSGTIVTSANESVVATAGHCVYDDGANVANSATMFVPGYKNGNTPFGIWDATEVLTTSQWMNGTRGDSRYDVGMIVLETQSGQTVQDAHGSRGIAFNQSAAQLFDAYGYPAADPYDGERLYKCDSALGYTDPQESAPAPNAIGCGMTQGSSGGGWLINSGGAEVLNSVVSYGYPSVPNIMFGPYFGTVVEALYNAAADTPGGTATSTPTSTPTGNEPVEHLSSLTLKLKKHLKAKGAMSPTDGYMPCNREAPVGIYKLVSASQGKLVKGVYTNSTGTYAIKIPDKKGKYFANVNPREIDANNLCLQAQSALVKHKH